MSASVQPHEDVEEYVCPACKDVLTDPILLPCLHSLCKTCLSTSYTQNISQRVFKCPQCDDDIEKPDNGVDEFQPNYFLNGLVSVYKAKTSKDIKCKICEFQKKDNFAILKCLSCGDFLCEDCGNAHTLTRMTMDHQVESLSELQDGRRDKDMRQKQIITCKTHDGESVKYYCESCSLPICRECQLEDHVGHTCATAKDSQASRRKAIANMIINVEQKIQALKQIAENVDSTVNDINKREKDLIEGVEKTVKKLMDQIEKEKTEILKGLKQTMDDQRDACAARKEQIKTLSDIFAGNVSFCNEIVKNGKDVEVLYQEKPIRRRLMALQSKNVSDLAMKWHAPDIRFRNVFLTVDRIGLFDLTLSKGFSRKPEAPLKFGARHVTGFQLIRRINTTVPREDSFECRATGLGFLYEDHFVVGDQENRKVKIFTRMGHYTETVANVKPSGLAICCDVIGVTDTMSLHLYTNDRTIKKKISLESTGSSYPVAALSDQNFIVVNNKTASFLMFDLRGELVHDVVPAKGSKIRNPVFITSNSKGHIIVSDWLSNCVIIMDDQGKTIKEFKIKAKMGKSAWLPGSICCDHFDNIYVSDFSRSRIIVLNPQGEFMFEHETRMDYLDRPRCMTTDGNGCLLVSGKGGYLNMYNIQYI
ncbi:E3 ubiquitin-protein ligase TRIM71-like [Mercenaria mercenaria]|uniref:E3 ubiquitin-protein ligase TRIM71-like n=1 Tax=Mercenaria mercenaria TaxID=6596 RepID=UPI00234E66D9|nr:E3 ubiquitin-protein ligase TRIM71-like [Mercenaria mercenaria]